MTRETRHNISMFALGAIILTAAALAKPDDDAGMSGSATVADQQADPAPRTATAPTGGTTGH